MKETIYKRIFVIVLDSLGIGAMPDSEKFGDRDVDTFGHILDRMGTLEIPNLRKLGMLNLHTGGKMYGIENPVGKITRLKEASNGKDFALVQATFDVVAFGLLGKDHGQSIAVSADGRQCNATGLCCEYFSDAADVKEPGKLVCNLPQKLGVHLMV